jgi:hypothetical protein
MKKVIVGVGGLIIAAALCGCSRQSDIHGQVFIVRKDSETVKLSGIPVILGDRPASNSLAQAMASVEKQKRELRDRAESLVEQLKGTLKQIEDVQVKERIAAQEVFAMETKISEIQSLIDNSSREMIRMSAKQREAQVKSNQTLHASIQKIKAEELAPLKTNLVTIRSESMKLQEKRDELERQGTAVSTTLATKLAEKEFFTSPLPKGIAVTLTDADGRFHFRANLSEKPVIIVRASRDVPLGGTEHYFWMEPVTGTNVVLSNINIARSFDEEKANGEARRTSL